jgi:hypothetical protein
MISQLLFVCDSIKLFLFKTRIVEQANPKTNRRREIIKIRAEINEIETKNFPSQMRKLDKSWFILISKDQVHI